MHAWLGGTNALNTPMPVNVTKPILGDAHTCIQKDDFLYSTYAALYNMEQYQIHHWVILAKYKVIKIYKTDFGPGCWLVTIQPFRTLLLVYKCFYGNKGAK